MEVIQSNNKSLVGLTGTILDETKNTIVVDTANTKKTVMKAKNTFKIGNTIIEGSSLVARPEERIKK